jgi:hypothetical protein
VRVSTEVVFRRQQFLAKRVDLPSRKSRSASPEESLLQAHAALAFDRLRQQRAVSRVLPGALSDFGAQRVDDATGRFHANFEENPLVVVARADRARYTATSADIDVSAGAVVCGSGEIAAVASAPATNAAHAKRRFCRRRCRSSFGSCDGGCRCRGARRGRGGPAPSERRTNTRTSFGRKVRILRERAPIEEGFEFRSAEFGEDRARSASVPPGCKCEVDPKTSGSRRSRRGGTPANAS